jgi:hypothetical protein
MIHVKLQFYVAIILTNLTRNIIVMTHVKLQFYVTSILNRFGRKIIVMINRKIAILRDKCIWRFYL